MKAEVFGGILIFIFIFLTGVITALYFSYNIAYKVYDAVEECERSLPRDQNCSWEIKTYVKGVGE